MAPFSKLPWTRTDKMAETPGMRVLSGCDQRKAVFEGGRLKEKLGVRDAERVCSCGVHSCSGEGLGQPRGRA